MTTDSAQRRILVTDGEQRAALAVVRSLGAAGHSVHVSSSGNHPLAGTSRFATSVITTPDPLRQPGRFADAVFAIAAANSIDTIIPVTEPALLALLPRKGQHPDVLIPFADVEIFSAISDKRAVLNAARDVGISVPFQTVLADVAAIGALDLDALAYPLVVKPARSVSTGTNDRLKLSVEHTGSAAELRVILEKIDPRAFPLLLQQRVIGPGVGIFVLVWDGALVASFAHERIREKPPSGGISVYRKSIAVDPELLRLSLALLAGFSWQGVAMVEYKIDQATGTPYLMEINGRFWGSLQLAIDAGVDFPRLLVDAASGQHPEPCTSFRTDVRSRWFWGDVDHLVARLRKSNETLSLAGDVPSKWGAVRNFMSHHPHDIEEVNRKGDRRPFLRESVQWFRDLAR